MACDDKTLRIAGIVPESIVDGPGLRLTVFVQGCFHGCPGCHNESSHDPLGGSELSVSEIISRIKRNPMLSGITLSGGEPMEQAEGCLSLVSSLPEGLTIWLYSGYTYEEIMASQDAARIALLQACDVLVDGRFLLSERSLDLRFRGSRNQRIIDLRSTWKQNRIVQWKPN